MPRRQPRHSLGTQVAAQQLHIPPASSLTVRPVSQATRHKARAIQQLG